MDIYFILWVIIQIFYLFCCSNYSDNGHRDLRLAPVFFLYAPILLTHSPQPFLFYAIPHFPYYKMFHPNLVFSLS